MDIILKGTVDPKITIMTLFTADLLSLQTIANSSQVTFIYIVPYTTQIVLKQLYRHNKENEQLNLIPVKRYDFLA